MAFTLYSGCNTWQGHSIRHKGPYTPLVVAGSWLLVQKYFELRLTAVEEEYHNCYAAGKNAKVAKMPTKYSALCTSLDVALVLGYMCC